MNSVYLNFEGYWNVNDANIPAKDGVYVVYACRKSSLSNLLIVSRMLYIGESENVNPRVLYHEKKARWIALLNSGEQLYITFASTKNLDRKRIEAALIYRYKPPVNFEYRLYFPYSQTRVISTGRLEFMVNDFVV